MSDKKVEVREKGVVTGYRTADHSGEKPVFEGRPLSALQKAAAAAKAKKEAEAAYESPIPIKKKKQ